MLALAAADLFCSPADNLQETFGLSVLEAMASSLPVVASDWNGYRDLVVHGSTGWLVPCRDLLRVQSQPDALDRRFSLGLQDYDSTVGYAAWVSCSIIPHWKKLWMICWPLQNLCSHGRSRPSSGSRVFSPGVSLAEQYRELWSELGERRASAHQRGCPSMANGPCRTSVCRPRQCSSLFRALVAGSTGQ